MMIETQTTPEPNVLKFFPPAPLLKTGAAEFTDLKSIRKSPLAEKLFDLGGIVSIFITADLVSVTKSDQADWTELKPLIMAELMDYLSTGETSVVNPASAACPAPEDDTVKQIEGLINARIRPAVKQDGGDIVFKKFEDGIVYVEMRGSCVGCPYAMVTLKEGVEKILKTYIPAVREVRNLQADQS